MRYLLLLISFVLCFAACEKTALIDNDLQQNKAVVEQTANDLFETRADFEAFLTEQTNIQTAEIDDIEQYQAQYKTDEIPTFPDDEETGCCLVGTPYNLTAGTNPFRTLLEYKGQTHIYFMVSRIIIDPVNQTINSYNIGTLKLNQNPENCYSSHWIIDVDTNIPLSELIIPGETYRFTAVICNKECFKAKSLIFIGE